MIRRLYRLYSDRFINRGFAQLEAHTRATDELMLTREHMLAYIEARLAARKLFREDRQASARKGVETRRKAA